MSHLSTDHGSGMRPHGWARRVQFEGDARLVRSLEGPIRRTLARRRRHYRVRIQNVGGCGEVLVAIPTVSGELRLRFAGEELDGGFVASVIANSLDRFAR